MEHTEKKIPEDTAVEYALIGWVLSNNKFMSSTGFLTAEHLFSAPHYDIWKAMEKLYTNGDPITPFTILPLLKAPEAMDPVGGVYKYLAGAMNQSLFLPHPMEGARYLVRLAQKRHLIRACEEVAEKASANDEATPEQHAMALARAIEQITMNSPLNEFQDNYQVNEEILNDLKDCRVPTSTGMPKLDTAMGGGLHAGKAYGFAARKKVGKTAMAATISANLNRNGVKHLFICGEMSPKEIQQRVMARLLGAYPSAFRTDFSKTGDFGSRLAEMTLRMPRNTLYKNAPGLTFDDMRMIYTTAVERYKVKGVILDYWQLVGGKSKGQSTAEHLDEVAQWIADFGRKHELWTITMAQINQEGNTRGGEGIRLAFDQIYQIHREDLSSDDTWIEMMETRYTSWQNIGSKEIPGLLMMEKGPYFEECGVRVEQFA